MHRKVYEIILPLYYIDVVIALHYIVLQGNYVVLHCGCALDSISFYYGQHD